MAFTEVTSLDADVTIALGGRNKKTGQANPTKAEGYYLGTRSVTSSKSKNGLAAIHFLQTPKGNLGIWGKTDMDKKFAGVPPGTMVRVSFDKMVPTPNGEMYKYKLEVDKNNTIDVSDLGAGNDFSTASDAGVDEDASYAIAEEDAGYDQDDVTQTAALTALEKKNRVEALLKGNKGRSGRN